MGRLSHTVSGDIASFRTPSRVPIESLKFHFLPKQAAGTPSPENPIPIEGWTGLNGYMSGYNVLPFDSVIPENYTAEVDGVTATYSNGIMHMTGNHNKAGWSNVIWFYTTWMSNPIVLPAGTYTVSDGLAVVCKIDDASYANQGGTFTVKNRALVQGFYAAVRGEGPVDIYLPLVLTVGTKRPKTYLPYKPIINIPITFPVAGTNKLDPSVILNNHGHFSLNNGIWSNVVTDERTYIQLAVQLWKSTGTYIKTLYVDYVKTTGRHVLTFTVDDPNGHYICLKHNGTKKDFILLFPWTFGLHQYTISLDVLSADPTTVGGVQLTNIQLEPGDTAHAYEPYSSDDTFYGGYVDPIKGEVWKEYEEIVFDGSDADAFTYVNTSDSSGISRHYFNTKVLDRIVKSNSTSIAYSDSATPTSNSFDHRTTICYYIGTPTNQVNLNIAATECDPTAESFNSYLQNHPVHLVYKLATPVLVATFDPITLQAFLDHNNFWSDANDITEVTYAVTESKDMLATRKKAMDFDHAHHKKVKWNNMAGAMNSDYWQRYNELSTSVLYENGEATLTVERTSTQRYIVSLYTKNNPYIYEDHRYYMSYMILSSYDNAGFGAEFAKDIYVDFPNISSNVWTRFSAASKAGGTGMGRIYIPYFKNETYQVGDYVKIKNVYYVDLTLMFGAGNEPTRAEFERICELNGIDLTTYQPYDEGSDRWLIIP